MTEQKICKNCPHWRYDCGYKVTTCPNGVLPTEPEMKLGWCLKLNKQKKSHETCNDWEAK